MQIKNQQFKSTPQQISEESYPPTPSLSPSRPQSPNPQSLLSGKKRLRKFNFQKRHYESFNQNFEYDEGVSDTTQYHSKDLVLNDGEKYLSHVDISEDEDDAKQNEELKQKL